MSRVRILNGQMKIEGVDQYEKHKSMNGAETIIKYIAQSSTDSIEAGGLTFNSVGKRLEHDLSIDSLFDSLDNIDFNTTLKKIGYQLSMYGKLMVVTVRKDYDALLGYGGQDWSLIYGYPMSYDCVDNKYNNVYLRCVELDRNVNGINELGAIHIYKKHFDENEPETTGVWVIKYGYLPSLNNNIEYSKMKYDDNYEIILDSKFKEFPGGLLRNNQNGDPDWLVVSDYLTEFDVALDEVPVELEWSKTRESTTRDSTDSDGKQYAKKVENGYRLKKGTTYYSGTDSMTGSGEPPFISGSQAPMVQMSWVATLEDRILKYALQQRDMSGTTGNNKHTTEVALFNQRSAEHLERQKIPQRQQDWNVIFKNGLFVAYNINGNPNIKFNTSEYESVKIDRLKAEISQLKSQAKYNNKQADYQKKATDLMKPETKKEN